jgi:hypothetical protein
MSRQSAVSQPACILPHSFRRQRDASGLEADQKVSLRSTRTCRHCTRSTGTKDWSSSDSLATRSANARLFYEVIQLMGSSKRKSREQTTRSCSSVSSTTASPSPSRRRQVDILYLRPFPYSSSGRRDLAPGRAVEHRSGLTIQADVNGPETQPIWKYLKSHSEPPVQDIDWVSFFARILLSSELMR